MCIPRCICRCDNENNTICEECFKSTGWEKKIPKGSVEISSTSACKFNAGFYVTLSERKLLYLTGSGSGAALCSSEDLLIMEGTGFSDVGV